MNSPARFGDVWPAIVAAHPEIFVAHTGGNCRAYALNLSGNRQLLITDEGALPAADYDKVDVFIFTADDEESHREVRAADLARIIDGEVRS